MVTNNFLLLSLIERKAKWGHINQKKCTRKGIEIVLYMVYFMNNVSIHYKTNLFNIFYRKIICAEVYEKNIMDNIPEGV
jgi:hypothetical protein